LRDLVTAAQAFELVESATRNDSRLAEALDVLRARVTPKPRKPKACPIAAAALKACKRPPSWSESPHSQRAAYLDTFGEDREAHELRLRGLELDSNPERARQFSYARPSHVKTDDEARTYLAAILDNGRGTA
jgi:hypothetical protein